MRLVLDTNIFISSFFWGGNPRKIMERIIGGQDELIIAAEILDEIASVMARPKFNTDTKHIAYFINTIDEIATRVIIGGEVKNVCRDSHDDMVLECGLRGNANYIITGDDDLLILKQFRDIEIITANGYVNFRTFATA